VHPATNRGVIAICWCKAIVFCGGRMGKMRIVGRHLKDRFCYEAMLVGRIIILESPLYDVPSLLMLMMAVQGLHRRRL